MEIEQESRKIFHGKFKWNWTHFMIGMGAFVPTAILFGVFMAGVQEPPVWFNWVMFVVFVPWILWSLFMTQKLELVGAYGESILLLIPTFIWLLPGHDESITVMIVIAFTLIMIGTVLYYGTMMFRIIKNHSNQNILKRLAPILIRLAFVAMSVVAMLIVSIILVNWGDHALKLVPTAADGSKDYSCSAWIVFIAVITILVALGLVLLGLASQFNFYFKRQNKKSFGQAVKDRRYNNKKPAGFVERTMLIDVSKKRRWWNRKK